MDKDNNFNANDRKWNQDEQKKNPNAPATPGTKSEHSKKDDDMKEEDAI